MSDLIVELLTSPGFWGGFLVTLVITQVLAWRERKAREARMDHLLGLAQRLTERPPERPPERSH